MTGSTMVLARASEPDRGERPSRRWLVVQGATLVLAAGASAFVFLTRGSSPSEVQTSVQPVPQGLPQAPDYHAVLVDEDNPLRVLVGTHDGVYESSNGGQTWQRTTLAGVDAMSLDSAADSTVWASGHGVLSLSVDGGETWRSVVPRGLPSLDIHAFAVDPADSRNLYAAIASRGLYHSKDGGVSFVRVSKDVGGKVVSLALTGSGELIASDSERGLLLTHDGGRSWEPLMSTPLSGLAVSPRNPRTILGGGPGVLLSWDGGRSFKEVLHLPRGASSVAWAPSNADVAYALGVDGVLYRTVDHGQTWRRAA
jgi:photosystem II stability/assembly factor-like uncharacterized protein